MQGWRNAGIPGCRTGLGLSHSVPLALLAAQPRDAEGFAPAPLGPWGKRDGGEEEPQEPPPCPAGCRRTCLPALGPAGTPRNPALLQGDRDQPGSARIKPKISLGSGPGSAGIKPGSVRISPGLARDQPRTSQEKPRIRPRDWPRDHVQTSWDQGSAQDHPGPAQISRNQPRIRPGPAWISPESGISSGSALYQLGSAQISQDQPRSTQDQLESA